ncbi:MAG: hypothetical protein IKS48_04725 [Eubacterium sp.]|nr:hypothetical protein [Eubacterium sp.]
MGETAAEGRKICRKCLLKEYDEKAYKETIEQYIQRMGSDMRADDDIYRRRLDICKECDKLIQGTCQACGCYVELRAAAKTGRCPKKKW